jgi:hypothetical protein
MKLHFPLSKSLSIGGGGWMQASARAEAQQTDSTATTTGLEDRCC